MQLAVPSALTGTAPPAPRDSLARRHRQSHRSRRPANPTDQRQYAAQPNLLSGGSEPICVDLSAESTRPTPSRCPRTTFWTTGTVAARVGETTALPGRRPRRPSRGATAVIFRGRRAHHTRRSRRIRIPQCARSCTYFGDRWCCCCSNRRQQNTCRRKRPVCLCPVRLLWVPGSR